MGIIPQNRAKQILFGFHEIPLKIGFITGNRVIGGEKQIRRRDLPTEDRYLPTEDRDHWTEDRDI